MLGVPAAGVVSETEAIAELDDPDLWLFRDRLFDAEGNETHAFWAAETIESTRALRTGSSIRNCTPMPCWPRFSPIQRTSPGTSIGRSSSLSR